VYLLAAASCGSPSPIQALSPKKGTREPGVVTHHSREVAVKST
jgi:hypothetical protein